jgi:hypothetical protein
MGTVGGAGGGRISFDSYEPVFIATTVQPTEAQQKKSVPFFKVYFNNSEVNTARRNNKLTVTHLVSSAGAHHLITDCVLFTEIHRYDRIFCKC